MDRLAKAEIKHGQGLNIKNFTRVHVMVEGESAGNSMYFAEITKLAKDQNLGKEVIKSVADAFELNELGGS